MQTSKILVNHIPDDVAWKALENLVDKFKFNEKEGMILMGGLPRASYYKGIKQHLGHLNRDTKERISLLLGIYKALRILFVDGYQAVTWINRENQLPPFNGMTPKAFMLEGSLMRLADVRRFLDFWRGY